MSSSPSPSRAVVYVASTPADYECAAALMQELQAWDTDEVRRLGLDAELAEAFYYAGNAPKPSGDLAESKGVVLLANVDRVAAGCAAIARLDVTTCELKRVWVRPSYRGLGLGSQLLLSVFAAARDAGYERIQLETVSFMQNAITLYRNHGFRDCAPFRAIPAEFQVVAHFMERTLD